MENNDAQTLDSPSVNTTLEDKERDEEQKKQMKASEWHFYEELQRHQRRRSAQNSKHRVEQQHHEFNINGAAAGISPRKGIYLEW